MHSSVLLVHDGRILSTPQGEEKYSVHFGDDIIERYSFFGKNVSFLMRGEEISKKDSKKYKKITYKNFRFIEIPNFKSLLNYYKKNKAKKIIRDAVKSHDVVIVRLPSAAGTIAFKYAKKYNKPVLVECVACVFDALWNYNWKGKLMAHYKYYQNRNLIKRSGHTIYVTSEFLQSRYPTNGKSIACSDVVLKDFHNRVFEKRSEKIQNHNGEPLVLGTVAALDVPYKGQADVIKAIGELKKQGIKMEYKLVGQGNPSRLANVISELEVEDRVEIVGPLPHDQVFDFLDGIDIYIQPSRQEGLPRAMVEALSRGCLTTGANTAGIPELIEDKFVFEAGDLEGINNILKSIDNEMLIDQAERNVREAMKYRTEVLEEKRLAFYERFKADYDL